MRSEYGYWCRRDAASTGFTLVEIAVTILLLGLLFAIAAPTMQQLSGSYHLKGAVQDVAGQLQLARARAIATGKNQHFHFAPMTGADYYIIDHSTGVISNRWTFPKGISYASSIGWVDMATDGRAKWGTLPASGYIVLQDTRGVRDTVSIEASGLVLTQ
jgi:prepilin-type N-terminal cleavage/methylation domain-containing protein